MRGARFSWSACPAPSLARILIDAIESADMVGLAIARPDLLVGLLGRGLRNFRGRSAHQRGADSTKRQQDIAASRFARAFGHCGASDIDQCAVWKHSTRRNAPQTNIIGV